MQQRHVFTVHFAALVYTDYVLRINKTSTIVLYSGPGTAWPISDLVQIVKRSEPSRFWLDKQITRHLACETNDSGSVSSVDWVVVKCFALICNWSNETLYPGKNVSSTVYKWGVNLDKA